MSSDSETALGELRPLRTLVLEDSLADVELIVAALRRGGYAVRFEFADSFSKFRERLESNSWDVILTDFNMRTWTAFDALEALRHSGRDIPLLVVTGTLVDEAAVELIKKGAADYVLKDRMARLPVAVSRALEMKRGSDARKLAERERIRLITAIEQSAEGIIITDTEGTIQYVNPAITRVTGYSSKELLGRKPSLLKSGKQDEAFYRELWDTILSGKVWRGQFVNRRKDGNLYNDETAITPVRDENEKITHFIATKKDTSEQKKLEDQLRQAQKMEAIGRMAGGIAHDFNNLLTVINGFSELLLGDGGLEQPARGRVEEIRKAGERAASLTRQLLAFSRLQVLQPKVLDLNEVISNSGKMLGRLIGEDVELTVTPGKDLWSVKADPGQIEQVIMNLVVNARDAMPDGGKLILETANVELDAACASAHMMAKPGPYVMLAVSDTGTGMDTQILSHLFEPFFTTKEKGKGTGLGLATVYGIVKQSGGSIWVYSEPGRGSTFKIYLPAAEEGRVAPRPSACACEREEQRGGSETVLLVEDETAVRSFARGVLESKGYRVLEASGGQEALRIARDTRHGIQVLLTDLVMPGMSGRELARRLARLHPETKCLFMSGYTGEAVVRNGELDAGRAFLQKPFTPDSISRKVRELLDTGR